MMLISSDFSRRVPRGWLLMVLVTAVLSACGGGGGGDGSGGGGGAETGKSSDCSPLTLAVGSIAQATWANTFEGVSATEVEFRTPVAGMTVKEYIKLDAGTGVFTAYGAYSHYVVTTGASTTVLDGKVVFATPPQDHEFALSAGQSTTPQTTTQTTTTTLTVDGVAQTPTTETTTTTSDAITFVGMETVTVPAGTFRTCKFVRTKASGSTYTYWSLVGHGGVGVSDDQGSAATAITVDGVALPSN
jgi:hypothetical protein